MRRSQKRSDLLATPELGKVAQNVSILIRQTSWSEFGVGRQRNPLARVWRLVRLRVIDRLTSTATLNEHKTFSI